MRYETIPAVEHYLTADPARVLQWKERLGHHGYRIGIAWQGNQLIMGSEGKAFPLAALEGIASLPGVRLIRLQKNAGSEQLDILPQGMTVESYDFDDGPDAFLDTAAMMKNCDLVITADIPLAAGVIDKGGHALDPRGESYTKDNIKERLAMRKLMDELRSSGVDTGGPATFGNADRQAFANKLDRFLADSPKYGIRN